jgi:WD40 repeat protein
VTQIEFLSTLKRHSAPVNCVRWSPLGSLVSFENLLDGQALCDSGKLMD